MSHEGAIRAWETRKENLRSKSITRAISIRQPYVEMILCGDKREEYRSGKTLIRERIYLYAALAAGDAPDWQRLGKHPGELPTGVIVGTVEIKDCYWNEPRKRYAYVLKDPIRLPQPLLPKNQPQPRFWRPEF
jgi:hypothetical protein